MAAQNSSTAYSSHLHGEQVEAPERANTLDGQLQITQDAGLHPVQPGLQAVLERDDYAPEIVEAPYHSGQAECDASTYATEEHTPALPKRKERGRWCRLTCKMLWILCGLFILLVVFGIVLGSVLGTRSAHTSTSPSSASLNPSASTSIAPTARTDTSAVPLVEAMKGSGLAAIKSPDQPSVLHMYWQDTEGNVLEGDLSTTNLTQLNKNIVVKSSDVKTGTPLSAIVWPSQPFSRILFYVHVNDSVMAMHKNADTWMRPYDALSGADKFASNGVALATCADSSSALNGFKLYFASANHDSISEASGDLGVDNQVSDSLGWRISQNFLNTDVESGAACTISGTILRIYVRNTSDQLEARRWDFTVPLDGWQHDASGQTIKAGASVAALSGRTFDRIVWQRNWDGKFELDRNADAKIQSEQETDEAIWQSRVSAVVNSTGVLVLYQSKTDETRISYKQIDLGISTDSEGKVIEGWKQDYELRERV